jgi:mono/diheme cytochrome c family protein
MLLALITLANLQAAPYSFAGAQAFLQQYCVKCHAGKSSAGGFKLDQVATNASLRSDAERWTKIFTRVRNGEMPPRGLPAPELDDRENFVQWIESALHAAVCAQDATPGPAPLRRLNRAEYSATIRDLLNIHMEVGHALPADGAGGEGFDNAAETLFLSPIHAEKYLDASRLALDFASRDAKSRARFLIAEPNERLRADDAARRILEAFLPRAFRRPLRGGDIAPYLALFQAAQKQGNSFQNSILFALRGVLVSPQFLFRVEAPNPGPESRLLDDYALASRLSYFLWGSMPDGLLFDLAEMGTLNDPEILKWQVARMLRSPKSLEFAESFVEQWLGTRELGHTINPDAKLFPIYAGDEELRGDIRYQPVLFFQEVLVRNLSLLNLIDSNFTILTRKLQKLYGTNITPPRPTASGQPQRMDLPEGSHRGGLLGMSAVLAVSSYPYRTSPVLRGKWVLDTMLGTPPPPPPPNVPALNEHPGATAQSMRERLSQHRADPVCASCHSRIDPLGFALENFDALGRWRTEDAGQPIDNQGQLPDGTRFAGPDELKAVLLGRKDLFLRNLTRKMLGYALGRGLTISDSCTVDRIVAELSRHDYGAQTLVEEIVLSSAFRYQAPAVARGSKSKLKELRSSR